MSTTIRLKIDQITVNDEGTTTNDFFKSGREGDTDEIFFVVAGGKGLAGIADISETETFTKQGDPFDISDGQTISNEIILQEFQLSNGEAASFVGTLAEDDPDIAGIVSGVVGTALGVAEGVLAVIAAPTVIAGIGIGAAAAATLTKSAIDLATAIEEGADQVIGGFIFYASLDKDGRPTFDWYKGKYTSDPVELAENQVKFDAVGGNSNYTFQVTAEVVDTLLATNSASLIGNSRSDLILSGITAIDGTGNDFNNRILGNSAINILSGLAGDDTLIGGSGDDTLIGGVGADTVIGDDGIDTASYAASSAGVNIDLTTGKGSGGDAEGDTFQTIENLEGSQHNDKLVGDTESNTLNGGNGFDVLDGGLSSDWMSGGSGVDYYYVDNTGDTIIEYISEGTDRVYSSVSYTLGNNLEDLNLTSSSAIGGTGNSLSNRIVGNDSINYLSGKDGDDYLYGEEGNDTLDGGTGNDYLSGSLGDDRYVIDDLGDRITENINEGKDTVQSSISYTLGNNLENLTLNGNGAVIGKGNSLNNIIIGSIADNSLHGDLGDDTLTGGRGEDTLDGGSGNDSMSGDSGDDNYIVDSTTDTISEQLDKGIDTVKSSASFTLSDNVENLTLTSTAAINGRGNQADNSIMGNDANNLLEGMDGSDSLLGGKGNDTLDGGQGNDLMEGDLGDDIYQVDSTTDQITESSNKGTDQVNSSITYTLGDNLENLTLIGNNTINGTGNNLNNTITGNSANNALDGSLGADSMLGGDGNDVYIVERTADNVTEYANQGKDTVKSSITYTLGKNLENLILTGKEPINGIGNNLENIILGNDTGNSLFGDAGKDTLFGGDGNDTLDGGVKNDVMAGGLGNDTYLVDSSTDQIIENENEGTDTVNASASYVLSDNLENLNLTGFNAINGTGNSLDNTINGNDAVNYIYAGSGADLVNSAGGDDYVYGEGGDDLIFGGNGNNNLNGGLGNDSISGNKGQDWLTGDLGNDELIGGAGADHLIGGMGKDTLVGGIDKDWLTGGMGADRFTFRSRKHGADIITDFRVSDRDQIVISAKGFSKKLKIGKLSAGQFTLGSAATDANDRFIYDSSTGSLFFDKDGTGSANQMQIATLSKGLSLSNRNISVIA